MSNSMLSRDTQGSERQHTGKIDKRRQQIEESVQRYLDAIETADRTSPTGFDVKAVRLYEKIARLRQEMRELAQIRKQLQKQPDKQLSMTDPDPTRGPWQQAAEAPASSATTFRSQWTRSTT